MLQVQPVEFEQDFTVLCKGCEGILFDLVKITQFVRSVEKNDHKISVTEKYFMLAPKISLSTLRIDPVPMLSKQRPFYMLFVSPVKCEKCSFDLGLKILTISSEIPNYEILGRLLISSNKVKIFNGRDDISHQVSGHFNEEWEQIRLSQNLQSLGLFDTEKNIRQQENKNKNSLPTEAQKPQGKPQKKHFEQNKQMMVLRKDLQKEEGEDKEVLKQLFSTIDFFTTVLNNLEERVSQTEAVCQTMKEKVERIVPSFRKM